MNERPNLIYITLAVVFSLLASVPAVWADEAVTVRRVEGSRVFVDAGRDAGLAVGDLLSLVESGEWIAEVEVMVVHDDWADCSIVRKRLPIRLGSIAEVKRLPTATPQPDPRAPTPYQGGPVIDTSADDSVRPAASRSASPAVRAIEPTTAEQPARQQSSNLDGLAGQDTLAVSYVAADSIYLDGGRSHGLAVGQTIQVVRDSEPVADLEIVFLSTKSSSCKVIESYGDREVELGDRAIPVPMLAASSQMPSQVAAQEGERVDQPASNTIIADAGGGSDHQGQRRDTSAKRLPVDLSGSLSLRYYQFSDAGDDPRDFDQTTVRLSLRARGAGDSPYEARIRVRGREDRRSRVDQVAETERRDRLYEMSLLYAPEDGKVSAQIGRIASSPLIGFDYLDGGLGEFRFKPRLGVGGFYGQRSEIDNLGFGSSGLAYGAFFHYERERNQDTPYYADILIGGIREFESSEISREYLSIYSRLGYGSRWSLYQRADIDWNRDWRQELTSSEYQVSNLLVSGSYRFSDSFRLGASYDHRRRFRDFDSRDTPEEIFDDRLREGFRLTAQIGDAQGLRLTSSAGIRRQDDDSEDNLTASGSLFHTNVGGINLLLGADFAGFSGDNADGARFSLRGRKYFRGGHDLGLTVGASSTRNQLLSGEDTSESQWIRLTGTARLPYRLFLLNEIEVTEGDDLAGERFILQLGYRL